MSVSLTQAHLSELVVIQSEHLDASEVPLLLREDIPKLLKAHATQVHLPQPLKVAVPYSLHQAV